MNANEWGVRHSDTGLERPMKPSYCQKPESKIHWRIPESLPGRQILAAIWRWM